MHRFFVPPDCVSGGRVALPQWAARQIARTLRLRPGDDIAVLDNSGSEYIARLDAVSASAADATIIRRIDDGGGEPALRLTVYQGMLKGDRFERVLQLGTELGASRFAPILCERTIGRGGGRGGSLGNGGGGAGRSRMERWRRIIREAAELSGRRRLPELADPMPFAAACRGIDEPALLAWECEREVGLRDALLGPAGDAARRAGRLSVIIGSEGGLTDEEAALAKSLGIPSVSLGPRAMRADTAAAGAVAVILYELGELG